MGGYAYVDPHEDVTADSRGDLITGRNVPTELVDALRISFFESMAFYEAQLDIGLPLVEPEIWAIATAPAIALNRQPCPLRE